MVANSVQDVAGTPKGFSHCRNVNASLSLDVSDMSDVFPYTYTHKLGLTVNSIFSQ